MTKIIIAGAGFGGLNAALLLDKKIGSQKDVSITLVDKHDYHLFSPNLYEVATAEEEMTTVGQLRQTVALPFQQLLKGTNIKFVRGEVSYVDQNRKQIKAGIRELEYDYLVLALGSAIEYFKVAGAPEYGLPLKNLSDAFRIRNAAEFAVQAHRQDAVKQYIRFVVAGGGYSGVELAGELAKLADILSWKNGYPREKIEIVVVEASNRLVQDFSNEASKQIFQRLMDLGVQIKLVSPIAKVQPHFVELLTGERIPFDVLIWAAGVRAREIPAAKPWAKNEKGQLQVDEFLRLGGHDNIFALGDMACIKAGKEKQLPATAQSAVAEAKYLAYCLPEFLQNKKPERFVFTQESFIVSVGGKWTLFKQGSHYSGGFVSYLLRLGANIRYFAGLLGWWKAVKSVLGQAEIYSRND